MQGNRTGITAALALAMITAGPAAFARNVYVNGVDIGDLRNQTFKDANVTIDEKGDVHIDAPRYKIEVVDENDKPLGTAADPSTPPGPNAALKNKYFLVVKPFDAGRAQFDVVVKVNGIERRVIKAGEPEVIVEISSWLAAGRNAVEISARKNIVGARKSTSAADSLRVVVGTGHEEGSIVKIDGVNVDFKCDASQLADIVKSYTVEAN